MKCTVGTSHVEIISLAEYCQRFHKTDAVAEADRIRKRAAYAESKGRMIDIYGAHGIGRVGRDWIVVLPYSNPDDNE